jgi:hypothetical protein
MTRSRILSPPLAHTEHYFVYELLQNILINLSFDWTTTAFSQRFDGDVGKLSLIGAVAVLFILLGDICVTHYLDFFFL